MRGSRDRVNAPVKEREREREREMQTRVEVLYQLAPDDQLLLVRHSDKRGVSLFTSISSHRLEGFCIHFQREHIGVIAELLEALEALPDVGTRAECTHTEEEV